MQGSGVTNKRARDKRKDKNMARCVEDGVVSQRNGLLHTDEEIDGRTEHKEGIANWYWK